MYEEGAMSVCPAQCLVSECLDLGKNPISTHILYLQAIKNKQLPWESGVIVSRERTAPVGSHPFHSGLASGDLGLNLGKE